MSLTTAIVIFLGACLGGLISGLAGFGTALIALGIWLHVLAPQPAAVLVIICSVIAQCQTLPAIRHAIDLRHLWPMLLAGILGVPLGVNLLAHVDPGIFRAVIGVVLIVFSAAMLITGSRPAIAYGGRPADAAVGFAGGILGGMAGLSGALPTIWASLRGWSKDQRRGVFQAYNLTVLAVALAVHAAAGRITRQVLLDLLCALPGTLLGTAAGAAAYRRLSDHHFHRVILILLGISGITLIWPILSAL